VWKELKPEAWRSLMLELQSGSEFSLRGGNLLGKCPYPEHSDSTPSFWVYPEKGYAKCYGCKRFVSNPVRFVADMGGFSWVQALQYLRTKHNITGFSKSVNEELASREQLGKVRQLIYMASKESLLASVAPFIANDEKSRYAIFFPALRYLESRGVPVRDRTLSYLPIGVLPPLSHLTTIIGSDLAQHAYKYLEAYMTPAYIGSLVFPYNDTPNTIGGFKVRADHLRPDGKRDVSYVKNPNGDPIGVYGLKFYRANLGGPTDTQDALVLEGEFDVITNMVGQLKDKRPYDIVLCTGGNTNIHLDDLEEFGIDRVLLVPDSPDHGGDEVASNWLEHTQMPAGVFSWPPFIQAKDPDDAIKQHGWSAWLRAMSERDPDTDRRMHFTLPHVWAATRLQRELEGADFEDVRALKTTAAEVGRCLTDPAEQKAYIDAAVAFTGLAPADLLALIVGKDDDEEGFIQRLVFALLQHYAFLGTAASSAGLLITFWHKSKRTLRKAHIARPSDLFSTLTADVGTFVDWATVHVGIPSWISLKTVRGQNGPTQVPVRYIDQEVIIKRYVDVALTRIISSLPAMKDRRELKAGCHYIDVKVEKGTEKRWVIVNGHDVYLGIPGDNGVILWRVLDGPQIGAYIFNLSRKEWSTELTSITDLNEGLGADLQGTFGFICRVLNAGWRFKHQQEDVEYLAAAIMINPVCSSLPRQLYTMLNGPRGSGKSSVLALLAKQSPTRLLESAFTMDSYTVAGFRKEMNNCSLGAVLDEFEDQGSDTASNAVRGILRDIRGLTSNPEARILRGNMDSVEATEYILRCQIWTAAIQYLRDAADVSRFVQVKMDVVEGHPNPKTTLETLFTLDEFRLARRSLTLGMFRKVPALLEEISWLRGIYANHEVMKELSEHAGVQVPSRYLDGVIIPAALMTLMGRDPHEFVRRFVRRKAAMLKQVVQTSHERSLLDHILSAQLQYTKPGTETRHTNVRTLLSDNMERELLNATECGVYYTSFRINESSHEKRHWLIVLWSDALHGVLKGVPQYRKETASRLKQLAEAGTSNVVRGEATNVIPGGIKAHLKVGIGLADITIFDITSLLSDWDNNGSGDS